MSRLGGGYQKKFSCNRESNVFLSTSTAVFDCDKGDRSANLSPPPICSSPGLNDWDQPPPPRLSSL